MGYVAEKRERERDMEGDSQAGKGGLRTMPFIFGNEIAEKLAVFGISANMISYLTKELHMPLAAAATTVTNFGGAASLTPLLGAFLADAYLGRFWTISLSSLIYLLGMLLLTLSSGVPELRRVSILYLSLFLNSLGAGGIRPCVVTFGADQFDEADDAMKTRTWNFFNWYYFCMGFSILVAVTGIVYVQDNVGWVWGFGIPTFAMAVSVVFFLAGYSLYRRLDPAGSPFKRLLQVAVAAWRKRRLPPVTESTPLYENPELDRAISLEGRLLHSKTLAFLDKAAIMAGDEEKKLDLWRLSTVHRVEELKSLIRMGPVWAAGILMVTAAAQQSTFSLQQARLMNRKLNSSSFQIPPGSMSVFTIISMLAVITVYDRALIPLARRFTRIPRGISYFTRMGIGFGISAAATLIAGFVEVWRRNSGGAPVSVFWLVPQYALHGAAEAFAAIGHLEFMYDQAPESMRSSAAAFFWLAISAGSYMSSFLVYLVHRFSAGDGGSNWLPDDLNKGRLEYFYWIITLLQIINLGYYVVCIRFYTFKPLQRRQLKEIDPEGEQGVELSVKP